MAIIPGLIVPPPEPLRRRYGLFDAAAGPIDLPTHGEGGGIRFVPVTCGEAYAYGVNCYTGEVVAPEKPLDSDNEEVAPGVFVVLATLECGAVGYTTQEYRAKVLRRLESTEQAAVERALWSGLDFEGNALDILNLDTEAVSIGTPDDDGTSITQVGATGNAVVGPTILRSVTLSSTDGATSGAGKLEVRDGAGGSVLLTLDVPQDESVTWDAEGSGLRFETAVHATIFGAGPGIFASFETQDVPLGYDPGLITDVVGALERYAYTTQGYGGVAYIHAPVEVAAFAAEAGLVLPEGPNRKVTPLGSVWSFGAYPAGEVIVTGQTAFWHAPEIQVYDSFDRITNQAVLVAERAYSVAFECFAGRAEFDPLEEVGS